MSKNDLLQKLCRDYLTRLKELANRYGLGSWVDETIKENANKTCSATEEEVEILSKICDDERVQRTDIPKILGVSYRHCVDNDVFDKIKKFPHVGIYSKISAILFKNNL